MFSSCLTVCDEWVFQWADGNQKHSVLNTDTHSDCMMGGLPSQTDWDFLFLWWRRGPSALEVWKQYLWGKREMFRKIRYNMHLNKCFRFWIWMHLFVTHPFHSVIPPSRQYRYKLRWRGHIRLRSHTHTLVYTLLHNGPQHTLTQSIRFRYLHLVCMYRNDWKLSMQDRCVQNKILAQYFSLVIVN